MCIPRRRLARSEYASERRPIRWRRVVLARFDVAATAPRRSRASVQHVAGGSLRRRKDWSGRTDRDRRRGLLRASFTNETFCPRGRIPSQSLLVFGIG
jgi:hypothetical protein